MKTIFFMLFFLCFPPFSMAQEGVLNKLLAPGPLIEGHKDLEHKDCLLCHEPSQGVPNSKCLDCHKEIKASVDKKNSYHGKQKKLCFECHPDHKGRNFDSTIVDQKAFDHDQTGYDLVGKHAKIECQECHKEKRTNKPINKTGIRWFGNKSTCLGCHKSDDIHFFKGKYAGKECSECHGQSAWERDVKFDHTRDAGYVLQGKHKDLQCKACHTTQNANSAKYDWPSLKSKGCISCHKEQHVGKMSQKFQGGRCEKCHSQASWKISNFDHEITGFILKGKHATTDCAECHKQSGVLKSEGRKNYFWMGLKQECQTCHKDHHAYSNYVSTNLGPLMRCERCHNEQGWKGQVNFNHNYDTQFDIDGKHIENKCFDCHIPQGGKQIKLPKKRIYDWPMLDSKTCETCHKSPHYGNFPPDLLKKKCTECHSTKGWDVLTSKDGMKAIFDHDKTRFPLTGKHTQAKCQDCHKDPKRKGYKFPHAEKKFCINCHTNVHTKQFSSTFYSKSCVECHSTNNFTERHAFDHGLTDFQITGKHLAFAEECSKCHVKDKQLILPTKPPQIGSQFLFKKIRGEYCINCHGNVHKDQFSKKFASQACTECHSTKGFEKRKEFDHKETGYILKGKHKNVECQKCHIDTDKLLTKNPPRKAGKYQFPELEEKNCATCHKDPHKGANGKSCDKCHSEKSWKVAGGGGGGDFHKNFRLSEVHYTLQCADCHDGNKLLADQSEECVLCHAKDDIHRGSMPTCHQCHRQSFWEITKFKHSDSLFPLRGSHRALNCNECHYSGIYQGLNAECVTCHLNDATQVVQPKHEGPNYIDCRSCHNEFSFGGATKE